MDDRRWRVAVFLGGVGNSSAPLVPLFALVALDQPVEVAAAAGAAHTFGSLLGNLLLWGRLADRLRSAKSLVVAGNAAWATVLITIALFPALAGVIALAALLGFVHVSMDAAWMRLVAGNLPPVERSAAILRYSGILQRGILGGFVIAAFGLPLLNAATDAGTALRIVLGTLGGLVAAEAVLAASTAGLRRAAPAFAATVTDLALSGTVVLWSGATGPVQRVIPLAGARPTYRVRLADSTRLALAAQVVRFLGFALHSGVLAVYLRQEAEFSDGGVAALLLAGAIMTNLTLPRVNEWLRTIPAVEVQAASAATRVLTFTGFALLALEPAAPWSVAGVILLYLLNQSAWGAVVPADAIRITALAPDRRRAEVVAYFGAAAAGGTAIGGVLGGVVAAGVGFEPAFAAAAAVTALATLLLLRW